MAKWLRKGFNMATLSLGKLFVLRMKEDGLHTLYYHLIEPNIEAEVQGMIDTMLYNTTVSLVLIFCLIVSDSTSAAKKIKNTSDVL